MLPPSELLLTTHALVDVAAHIKVFGPVTTWWTLASERAYGDTKEKNTKGGAVNYLTCFQREYQEADAIMKQELDVDLDEILHEQYRSSPSSDSFLAKNARTFLKIDKDSNTLQVIPPQSCVDKAREIPKCELNVSDNILILEMFIGYLKALAPNNSPDALHNNLCGKSFFYRMYVMFKYAKRAKSELFVLCGKQTKSGSSEDIQFAGWLQRLRGSVRKMWSEKRLSRDFFIVDFNPEALDIYSNLCEGKMFFKDYRILKQYDSAFTDLMIETLCSFYDKATHNGIAVRGRYCHNQSKKGENQADENELPSMLGTKDSSFISKEQFSSWVFLCEDIESEKIKVGQISFFFTLKPDIDSVLDSQIWIHYVPYKTKDTYSKVFFRRLRFVSSAVVIKGGKFGNIEEVFPSRIAVLPLHFTGSTHNQKPKLFTTSIKEIAPHQAARCFNSTIENVTTLCLFPLDPNNRYVD
jgi:hypothetical protein